MKTENRIKIGRNYQAKDVYSQHYPYDFQQDTLSNYVRKMKNVLDGNSLSNCNLRDILMIGMGGHSRVIGNEVFGKTKYDYVDIDGEEMILRQDVGNIKQLSDASHKLKLIDQTKNVVLYGKNKIYVFESPFTYYMFERDEDMKIMVEDYNEEFKWMGAPGMPDGDHFEKTVILAKTEEENEITISDENKIMLYNCIESKEGLELSPEEALSLIKGTRVEIEKLNEEEQITYTKLKMMSKKEKEIQEHPVSEIIDVVSDRKADDVNKVVSEISTEMQEASKDKEQTKEA